MVVDEEAYCCTWLPRGSYVRFSRRLHALICDYSLQMVQRALTESPLSAQEGVDADSTGGRDAGGPTTIASQASRSPSRVPPQPGSPRTPHPLKLDGILLQQAIWVAAVVDSDRFSLDVFVACLVAGVVCVCALIGWCVWRRWSRLSRARRNPKEAGGVKVFRGPQRVSASAGKKEKAA